MKKSNIKNVHYFKNRKQWRVWLAKNYDKKSEAWLIYYKKHTNTANIPYNDAVEEALCFGWIDGQVKRIDNEKHMQRFSPRRERSVWAESNIKRVKKMIKLSKMTKSGLEKFKHHKKTRVPTILEMPKELESVLRSDKQAWDNFQKFPPSHKKHFYGWIFIAKSPETKEKRIQSVVKRAFENRKLA